MCRLHLVKLAGPLERVLRVFLADASARRYGYDLMKAARLPSGTLYPMLARLHDQGLVTSEWEPKPDDASGRPPRKYYQLIGEGIRVARLELAQAAQAASRTTHGTAPASTRERALTRRPLAQRIAEHLIRRACRYLPGEIRDERSREWAAELPAILHDPGIRFAPPALSPRAHLCRRHLQKHSLPTRGAQEEAGRRRCRVCGRAPVHQRGHLDRPGLAHRGFPATRPLDSAGRRGKRRQRRVRRGPGSKALFVALPT